MRLGVVGTGMIARLIVPHLADWGWCVRAICSTPKSIEAAQELAGTSADVAVFTDLDDMLTHAEIDAVYLAVPNHLHHDMAMRALAAGKHTLVEKPFTSTVEEAEDLARFARERNKLLFETVSTLYRPGFAKLRELLPRIGTIKIATCNFSKYSSRYDAFRSGEILPAFDPAKSGGALMDLGLYNMHYLIGLFGVPAEAVYRPNMERGIDTSGVMELSYDGFRAVSIAGKDSNAPAYSVIQGTEGYLAHESPTSHCDAVVLHLNDGTEERFDINPTLPWEGAFRAIATMIAEDDQESYRSLLEQTLAVSRVMTKARRQAGIWFSADAR
ncbi:Gfo/Idh/MocA family oxidoreductase [Collinsella sp. AGMB00827]|uniref:Gfo/Idh/MocA family oxidoreductase n=1 Tax=Collinsella ureilytica TaxID=2869515 RepID=A0ABS7MIV4_9ACTN|nr:Gfo/Idh/MocA family oxidoreductase [Collinsella urealyticum]MBY4797284.1 Gfo/Idh/MocA family oxidoreductase [Collinsella urealyticum]